MADSDSANDFLLIQGATQNFTASDSDDSFDEQLHLPPRSPSMHKHTEVDSDEELEHVLRWYHDMLYGKTHAWAWAVAGACTLLCCSFAFMSVWGHLQNYHLPRRQRHVVRILWMAPIYALDSFLSLLFLRYSYLFDVPRDCYESWVIYNFMALCVDYMGGDDKAQRYFSAQAAVEHGWPLRRCLPAHTPGSFLWRCKLCTLQYSLLKPVTALATIVLKGLGEYRKGDFSTAYLWITVLNNASVTLALYYLALFYKASKSNKPLQAGKPLAKFLAVKSVIFFSFWQTVAIYVLSYCHVINSDVAYDDEQVQVGLADFLLCVEMMVVAALHPWVFSSREHSPHLQYGPLEEDNEEARTLASGEGVEMSGRRALRHMFHVEDVLGDMSHIRRHYYERFYGKPRPSESGASEL